MNINVIKIKWAKFFPPNLIILNFAANHKDNINVNRKTG